MPDGAGSPAQTGTFASLQAGGHTAEAKRAFVRFFLAVQEEDVGTLSALLQPDVLVLRGRQRRSRDALVGMLEHIFDRLSLERRAPDELVDQSSIEIVEAARSGDRFPAGALEPTDIVVEGNVQFRSHRPGVVRQDARVMVFRTVGRRLLVVAIDRWPPVP